MNDTFDTNAHTPGPWKADPRRLVIQTRSGDVEGPVMSYLIGNKTSVPGTVISIASERHADHYLCAAAPDLLIALRSLVACVERDRTGAGILLPTEVALANAKEAIAKAIGAPL